jgi:hypothetical protein
MGKLHITIEDSFITGVHCTDNVKRLKTLYPKAKIVDVEESFSGGEGESVKLFDDNWNRRLIIV